MSGNFDKEAAGKRFIDNLDKQLDIGAGLFGKTTRSERLVGIAYSNWHRMDGFWKDGTWDEPIIGKYDSADEKVLEYHAKLLANANIDFVMLDWSNNTAFFGDPDRHPDLAKIEESSEKLFEVWSKIPGAPKICFLSGPGHAGPENVANGNHQKKVNQIFDSFAGNPKYKDMYFNYLGKPLLVCYGATPTFYGPDPEWNDDRFTVRWATGYVGQQPCLFDNETRRSYRYWSWEERGIQTFTVYDGQVEAITCTAAQRIENTDDESTYIPYVEKCHGKTLIREFKRADILGAKIVMVVSFNEWTNSEQINKDVAKDIEPSKIFGSFYYDLLSRLIREYKGIEKRDLIENKTYSQERALYGISHKHIKNCSFEGEEDGESAFKETSSLTIENCHFLLRYPMWHLTDGFVIDCNLEETCRAALWYDKNIALAGCRLHGPKALRECENVYMLDDDVVSDEFGWNCNNLTLSNSSVEASYGFKDSKNMHFDGLTFKGKYSFQYAENVVIKNSFLDTKDAFWHAKNVTVYDSVIKGEYLAWYSENLKLVRCKIIGTQPLCYCKNLILEDCVTEDCDRAFEKSEVHAAIKGHLDSIQLPYEGEINADSIGEIAEAFK